MLCYSWTRELILLAASMGAPAEKYKVVSKTPYKIEIYFYVLSVPSKYKYKYRNTDSSIGAATEKYNVPH